jgi:mercuric ion transport protein
MKSTVTLSVFTALGASLCCITPLLALAAGTSSIATTFSWVEPARPYLAFASIFILSFAWYRNISAKKADDCGCEPRTNFLQSKRVLSIITVISLLITTFPSYSKFLFDRNIAFTDQQQEKKRKIELAISGMTCTSCEIHIEGEVKRLPGVSLVRASYEKGSAVVEFDETKVDKEKIVATINATGYTVDGSGLSSMLAGKENCTATSCQIPTGDLPKEISKDLVVLRSVDQIKAAFNKEPQKTRFVAILSSTCKWCLLGAESVQKAIVENMAKKNISVIIVWTNMLTSDGENTAYRAASLFKQKNIAQFFDQENKFGDIAAKAISSRGEQAWDIYMYFDKSLTWQESLPRPFEYVHQLGPSTTWADQTKYFCGNNLTKRLQDITANL